MKRILMLFVCLALVFGLFAADQIATLENGKKVVLHDNGRWEYSTNTTDANSILGKWTLDREYVLEQLLSAAGVTPDMYYIYMNYLSVFGFDEILQTLDLEFVFSEKECKVSLPDGDTLEGTYEIGDKGMFVLTANGTSQVMGYFNDERTKLYFVGSSEELQIVYIKDGSTTQGQ